MKTIRIYVSVNGRSETLSVLAGRSLLDSLRDGGYRLNALCARLGRCGACAVRLTGGHIDISDADRACFSEARLEAGWRLSCAAYPTDDISVEIPDSGEDRLQGMVTFQQNPKGTNVLEIKELRLAKEKKSFSEQVAGDEELSPDLSRDIGRIASEAEPLAERAGEKLIYAAKYDRAFVKVSATRPELYAVGVDIGTTTVGMVLINLKEGSVVAHLSFVNKQREYGADVISRIAKSKEDGPGILSAIIRNQIEEGVERLCRDQMVPTESVVRIAITGNTTMLHLFWGFPCDSLGSYPFTPVSLGWLKARYNQVFQGKLDCDIVSLPGISAYIGADIAAGLLYLGTREREKPYILLDIGTNGEMALVSAKGIICASTAAGPALEGVNISWGTGSVPGAISRVWLGPSGFETATIGDETPLGICGSGVIDSAYCFLRHGVINESGGFNKGFDPGGVEIAKTAYGDSISVCQKDIREIQLAKSAVRSGLEILLEREGISYGDLSALYIAGGFGYNIDYESAIGIGLIPEETRNKIRLAGNSALGGVTSYLADPGLKGALDDIIAVAKEFSLSESEEFYDKFISYMSF